MKNKNGFKIKLTAIALVVILALISFGLSKGWSRSQEVAQEVNGLNDDIQTVEKDNLELKELVQYLNSDAFIEEKARTDLGLKNPNEKVVVVGQTPIITNTAESAREQKQTTSTNPQKWWSYFFN